MNDPKQLRSQLSEWPAVRHYYGDVVRIIFVVCAIVIGLVIPLGGSLAVSIIGMPIVLALVVLAGFTNPHSKTIMILDTVAAALGILVAEVYAIGAYLGQSLYLFVLFEVLSVLLLVALYFSAKNVRAAMMHKIGKIDGVGEFDEPLS